MEGTAQATPGSDPKARPNVDERGLSLPWPLRAAISPQPHICSLLMVQVEWQHLCPPPHPGTCVCGQLGEEVRSILLGEALTLDQVTHSVLGAAVQVVGAADGLGEGEVVFGISSLPGAQGAARLTAGTAPIPH